MLRIVMRQSTAELVSDRGKYITYDMRQEGQQPYINYF